MVSMWQVILILLFNFHITNNLFACSCIGESTVATGVKSSDAVLLGTVLSKKIVTIFDSTILRMFPGDNRIQNSPLSKLTVACYDFVVTDRYKGKITRDTVKIYTGLGGGDCGVEFEIGGNYIVYADSETYFGQANNDFKFPKGRNIFWTNICMRTKSYNKVEIDEIKKYVKKPRYNSRVV